MDCIVTAGPTYEPLDQARRITNFSTGRLGCELAAFLKSRGHRVQLFLGEQATWRGPIDAHDVTKFSTGADLSGKLSSMAGESIGAVFHAAAVSDFAFGEAWRRTGNGSLEKVREGKYSTARGPLLVELVPTPKIIARLRGWFPKALLAGWKYEVDGGKEKVLETAQEQISGNKTDICVVNGPAYGDGFGLVLPGGEAIHVENSERLFKALADSAVGHLDT
jgi:phosphopantothenoylcysteine decarboxylase/phosphopantothenate--cysteine ligase